MGWQVAVFKRKESSGYCVVVNVDKGKQQIHLVDGEWDGSEFTPTKEKKFWYKPAITGLFGGFGFCGKRQGAEGKQWVEETLFPYVENSVKKQRLDLALLNSLGGA